MQESFDNWPRLDLETMQKEMREILRTLEANTTLKIFSVAADKVITVSEMKMTICHRHKEILLSTTITSVVSRATCEFIDKIVTMKIKEANWLRCLKKKNWGNS